MSYAHLNTNAKLTVTLTNNKSGKYHYRVIDHLGGVISERHSNREYAAACHNGFKYFGRIELALKYINGDCKKFSNMPAVAFFEETPPFEIK
jgi:hypothetical protein